MNALEKIREISNMLTDCGIEAAGKEAEIIIRQGLGLELTDLFTDNPELTDEQALTIDAMVSRRGKREPLQYITGHCDFMGLKILVGCGVLIPRPETELMAEQAIKTIRGQQSAVSIRKNSKLCKGVLPYAPTKTSNLQIMDLCTGSGCLALALAKEFPEAHVLGIDISETALDYSKRNSELNKIENVEFAKGHLFEPLDGRANPAPTFDLIISNPPYIKTDDIKTLQSEIRDWEPIGALDGGNDGLNFYREIISQAGKFLKTNGILMLELGAGCADETVRMMKVAGYEDVELLKDYAGIERIIQGKWTS